MYNPISTNVIRQAIEWHTDATPLHIKREFWHKWPNGNITTIYDLEFDRIEVAIAIGYILIECDQDLNPFVDLLNGCFCDDCHVIERHYDRNTGSVHIKLYAYF